MRRIRTIAIWIGAVILSLCAAVPASAEFGLKGFETTFIDENGAPMTQAGSHPYALRTSFSLNTRFDAELGKEVPDGELKSLQIRLPEGMAGNPTATPLCSPSDFVAFEGEHSACPESSVVGALAFRVLTPGEPSAATPVYNLDPPPGVASMIGFIVANTPVTVESTLDSSPPYGIVSNLKNINQTAFLFSSRLELWGVPGDKSHDPYRGRCLLRGDVDGEEFLSTGESCAGPQPRPFLTMPRSCEGPLTTSYEAVSWQGGATDEGSDVTPGMAGCSKIGFAADVSVSPTTSSAESPSGLDFSLEVDDEGLTSPTGEAQSDIEVVRTALPPGMTLNPSAAAGLEACTKEQYDREALETPPGGGCPQASKIGEVEVESPLLEEKTLRGQVYLASQDDNPFGSLTALYMVIRDKGLGIFVKQAGEAGVEEGLGSATGQITTIFEDLPQVPLSRVTLRLNDGPRAPVVTPPTCGAYASQVQLTPRAEPSSPFAVDAGFEIASGVGGGPCPLGPSPFMPVLSAGTLDNAASAYSPYLLRLTRNDGEQQLTRFDATLPPGVAGSIAGIPRCPDAAIEAARAKSGREEMAASSCPAGSRIGRVMAGAGVGPSLTYVPGTIYLAGPYAGAPLSVVAIVPAVAGPLDVGNVVTRLGLMLDPNSYRVQIDSTRSEPLPYSLKGIPVRLRDLRAYIERTNFIFNSTGCDERSTQMRLFGSSADPFNSADDLPVDLSERYQAADCDHLGFGPKLSLRLKGGIKRGDHPALHSTVTYPYPSGPGYSNIARAVVTLPPTQFIDNAHIQNPCTRVQFNADACPKGSILGRARAVTPLLDNPLEGPVYFRSNGGDRLLPDIVADLHGEFDVVLSGFVSSKKGRLRTVFASAPDAPVTKFTLNLAGGKRGLLVNSTNLCRAKLRAHLVLTAHSGDRRESNPRVKTSCK